MICLNEIPVRERPSVVTLGKFDGLHRGHQSLLKKVGDLSADNGIVFVMDASTSGLLGRRERTEAMAATGLSAMLELPLTREFMSMTAEDFVRQVLVGRLKARAVVVGENYRFGSGRAGDLALLEKMGEELGFETYGLPMVTEKNERISSTAIRAALSEGRMEEVNDLLGYTFSVRGEIVHGAHLGQSIGVPTVNILPGEDKLLPPNGVYFSLVRIEGRTYRGMTNIGFKPTVQGGFKGVETYLFDCSKDLYGKEETVFLLSFSRPEKNFGSVAALTERLAEDKRETAEYFKKNPDIRAISLDEALGSVL